ncbi:hypothetical protein FISHEDRAFT_72753 [Fistulina hepatica ATCC 64428]|nr:hypothetical protein FISHEDRAFT_72753 [Fistulina hepatica ATCC 64428]
MQLAVDDSSASRKTSEKVLYDNMAAILTCWHCGHDAFPPLPTGSFEVQELKEVLRDGFLPSSSTMRHIEQEIAILEATIKEVNNMLEDARTALVQGLNPVVEYLAVARSISSPIRQLPGELLSNVFSYLITPCSNGLQDAMFEAGILGHRGSTVHRLASVCKYWWCVVRDTPMLCPVAYVSHGANGVLAVRRYIEMASSYPLKFSLRDDLHPYSDLRTRQMEAIDYCAVVQELVNASYRWQIADLECMERFGLENASDFETQIATCVYRSSYPVLKELCLRSFPMSQFFSQERVPALRALKLYDCQIELHAVQPILLQITNLDLRCVKSINVDLNFHAIDTRSPVLLPHLRRLHVTFSIFMLDIITAPNLVHFHLIDDSLHLNVVDVFLRRSRCNIESLHLGICGPSTASSIVKLWRQMPQVTHLTIPADEGIWVPLKEHTPDGRFSVFPQLQHLEIYYPVRTWVVSDIMRVVLKRCGARKITVEGRTGYRKSKKPPVLRRLDISCPLTQLQRRTLLVLSECGALDVCCSVSGKPAGNAGSHYDIDGSDSDEEEDSASSDGDDDGVVYI